MALNGILNTALSGLFTNQEALRVVSNNVANVNNPNYTRLRVSQEAIVLQGQAAGVRVASVERVVDEFLQTATRTASSNTAEFTVQREFHDRLQGVLGNPDSDSSLSARLDRSFNSLASLALAPADSLRRQQSLSDIDSYLSLIDNYEGQIQALRTDVSLQLDETIEDANEIIRQIHELNPLLVSRSTITDDAGATESQLDIALAQLAELIDIRVERVSTGGVVVRTATGLPLVDAGTLSQLSYNSPGLVDADTRFPPIQLTRVDTDTLQPEGSPIDVTGGIGSGRLQGLINLRDDSLEDLTIALGEVAARVRDGFNAIHNQFTAVPAPNQLTGSQTIVAGTHAPGFTGVVTFAAVDSNSRLVNSVTIDFDTAPPATFNALIAQVNAGLGGAATLSLNNGVVSFTGAGSNGVSIADDATNPSQRAGRGFSHFFGLNDLISSRSDGIFETGVSGTDTHGITAGQSFTLRVTGPNSQQLSRITVSNLGTDYNAVLAELNNVAGLGAFYSFALDTNGKITATPLPGREGTSLQVEDDTTNIGGTGVTFTEAFGLASTARVQAANDLQIRRDISLNPNLFALAALNTGGAVGDFVLTDGDQRGALALQGLETTLVVSANAGELRAGNSTLTQLTSRWLGNVGLQARRVTTLEEDNQSLFLELDQRRSDVSGVNMDEELSNLVVFQNAYNASARILTAVQELYDTLLEVV